MIKIKQYLREMEGILREIGEARNNIITVMQEIKELDTKYHRGIYDYKEYVSIKKKILANRSRNEVLASYRNYMKSLRSRLAELNSKILKKISADKSYEHLTAGRHRLKHTDINLPPLDDLEIGEVEIQELHELKEPSRPPPPQPEEPVPRPHELEAYKPPEPVKLGFFKRLIYAFQAKEKPWLDEMEQNNVKFGGFLSTAFLKYLLFGKEKDRGIFGETQVLPSILSFDEKTNLDKDLSLTKADVLDPYKLERQIKELKHLISKKRPTVYKASTLGYLANISVRRISIFFIEKYPNLFKKLYQAIRFANLKILANTYINIIFFLAIISMLLSMPIFTVIFTLQRHPAYLVLLYTLLAVFIVTNLTFWSGFYYPFMKAKSRRRSINTNLPFAIDHMSSVIASGVSPATMFKLISNSYEYGEISIEVEKVSHYVDFFGYDILTALKAVSITTPSEDFKEFIDGFVSAIETGGDLNNYLRQKSSEALLNYRLERQKYVESLSTYSDIYTGVLIAAPLFFVTALSLVSVLGGSIGGLSVNSIITIGTYLIIPGLNVVFLIFLEINQPEI